VFGELVEGDLSQPGQEDYYRFDGLKGQVLWIDVDAQDIDGVSLDPTYIDTVVTLFTEADDKKLAQNNNPTEFSTADSRLYTILPEDGTYCIRVAECHSVISNPGSNCYSDPAEHLEHLLRDERLRAHRRRPRRLQHRRPRGRQRPPVPPPRSTSSSPTPAAISPLICGAITTPSTTSTSSSSPCPADVPVPFDARAHFNVTAFSAGTTGSGSSIPTGEMVIVDPDVPDLPIARLDPSKSEELQVPLVLDKEYWLFVNRPPSTPEENDFYFLSAFPGWGNPLEIDDVVNTDPATPEALASPTRTAPSSRVTSPPSPTSITTSSRCPPATRS
jgi:hypothetical protein